MPTKKKRIIDDATKISADFLQPVFGGDNSAVPGSPERDGHLHDGGDTWGHAQKVDLATHTTGRLVLQDQFSVTKTISQSSHAAAVIGNSLVWYFSVPTDLDITKPAYFSFNWMGDSSSNNIITSTSFQTTVFKITWQWYIPGSAVFAPAVIFDLQPPANQPGSNINGNTLTRGRIPAFTVNAAPFTLFVNDSAAGVPNFVKLTGLDQAQDAVMAGIQIEVVNTGFTNGVVFLNGNMLYLSKTIGGVNTSIPSLNG